MTAPDSVFPPNSPSPKAMGRYGGRLRRLWAGLWCAFTFYILYGTLFPFSFVFLDNPFEAEVPLGRVLELHPFTGWGDVVANGVFFLPFGFLTMKILVPGGLQWGRVLAGLALATIASFFLSYFVEYLQLYIHQRHTSRVDLFLNTLGGLGGALAAVLVPIQVKVSRPWMFLRQLVDRKWALPAILGLVMVGVEQLQPFDITLIWSESVRKFGQMTSLHSFFSGGLFFSYARLLVIAAIASSLVHAWFFELKFRKFGLLAVLTVFSLGTSLELMQLIIRSRMPYLQDAGILFTGAIVGGLVFQFIPKKNPVGMVLFWGLAGIACSFVFSSGISGNMDQARGAREFSSEAMWVSMLISQMMLFVFLGFIITYIYKEFRFSKRILLSLISLGVAFLVSVRYFLQFSIFDDASRLVVPALSLSLGSAACMWVMMVLGDLSVIRKFQGKDPT